MKAKDLKSGMVVITEGWDDEEIRITLDSVTVGNGIVRYTGTVRGPGREYTGEGYYGSYEVEVEVEK